MAKNWVFVGCKQNATNKGENGATLKDKAALLTSKKEIEDLTKDLKFYRRLIFIEAGVIRGYSL